MSERCNVIVGQERFDEDEPWTPVHCLLPAKHEGPHADWSAWLGVKEPDFSESGKSKAAR
jgi:hypothetical protein